MRLPVLSGPKTGEGVEDGGFLDPFGAMPNPRLTTVPGQALPRSVPPGSAAAGAAPSQDAERARPEWLSRCGIGADEWPPDRNRQPGDRINIVSARTYLPEPTPVFHALNGLSSAVPTTPTPCYLIAIAATTTLAAGLWLRYLSR
ncbi:MAG: hypothetical protein JWP76_5148 [Dactylosporangium sp.]|jgi:hypothetical protein|nr:hypothetical protein [Dactylosporangium sp.]